MILHPGKPRVSDVPTTLSRGRRKERERERTHAVGVGTRFEGALEARPGRVDGAEASVDGRDVFNVAVQLVDGRDALAEILQGSEERSG